MHVPCSIIRSTKEELMDAARKLGEEYEREAHYCPQATLAALMDVLHFRDDTLFRSCFAFNGGGGDSNDGALLRSAISSGELGRSSI
jgi:hypothetical protein